VSGDAWIVLATLVAMVASMARGVLSPPAALVAATAFVYGVGVIEAEDALAGLSNPATVTIAGLYVVAGAVSHVDLLGPLIRRIAGPGAGRVTLGRLLVPSAASSAFVANTPVLAMMVPAVVRWADDNGNSPSRYLLPLSYATILGGALTVVGTSTNLVASGLADDSGLGDFSLFEPALVAGPIAVFGLILIVLTAPLLVPGRRPPHAETNPASQPLAVRMTVVAGGPLDGLNVGLANLRELDGVYLAEIERGDMRIAPVAPDRRLTAGDRLVFVGDVDRVGDLHAHPGLDPVAGEHPLDGGVFHEAVIGPTSPLVGRTVRGSDFRSRHQAVVIAIDRAGERLSGKLGPETLRAGDSLQLRAGPDFDPESSACRRDFILVTRMGAAEPVVDSPSAAVMPTVAVALVVLLPLVGDVSLLRAVTAAVGLLVLSRTIRPRDVWGFVNLNVVAMIAAAIGLGRAVAVSGLADDLADGIIDSLGSAGDFWAVLGVLLAAMILTEAITNVAAVALIFPTAVTVAGSTGIDPATMVIGVAVAASMSFLTPIGYQTNTMVWGPGRYRFGDYLRFGAPLWLVAWLGATTMVVLLG
jgi:di/tricarboxylate transporter